MLSFFSCRRWVLRAVAAASWQRGPYDRTAGTTGTRGCNTALASDVEIHAVAEAVESLAPAFDNIRPPQGIGSFALEQALEIFAPAFENLRLVPVANILALAQVAVTHTQAEAVENLRRAQDAEAPAPVQTAAHTEPRGLIASEGWTTIQAREAQPSLADLLHLHS